MKKRIKRIGFLLILAGFILIADSPWTSLTGNIISEKPNLAGSIWGFILIVFGGLVIFASEKKGLETLVEKEEKNLAQQIKESGKVDTKTKFLKKVARQSGYILGNPVREGTPVYDRNSNRITVIPLHKTVTEGTYRSIIKSLASGESSFRKYDK